MEHFLSYSDNTDNYSEKITLNDYTQGENIMQDEKTFETKNILEIILSLKDYNYQILDSSEKKEYVTKKSLELSTFLDLNYDNYNYNTRKFNKNNVCNSLQSMNNLSAVLFYNDYYKVNIVICNQLPDSLKLYKTSIHPNNKEYIFIKYSNNNFSLIEDITTVISDFDKDKYIFNDLFELQGNTKDSNYVLKNVLNMDIKDNMIYKLDLKAITSYKSEDLIKLAEENNISINKSNGKKYNKKELYDIINLHLLSKK